MLERRKTNGCVPLSASRANLCSCLVDIPAARASLGVEEANEGARAQLPACMHDYWHVRLHARKPKSRRRCRNASNMRSTRFDRRAGAHERAWTIPAWPSLASCLPAHAATRIARPPQSGWLTASPLSLWSGLKRAIAPAVTASPLHRHGSTAISSMAVAISAGLASGHAGSTVLGA